jgi:hypothetical protein
MTLGLPLPQADWFGSTDTVILPFVVVIGKASNWSK